MAYGQNALSCDPLIQRSHTFYNTLQTKQKPQIT